MKEKKSCKSVPNPRSICCIDTTVISNNSWHLDKRLGNGTDHTSEMRMWASYNYKHHSINLVSYFTSRQDCLDPQDKSLNTAAKTVDCKEGEEGCNARTESPVYHHYCNTLSTPDETTGDIMFFHTGYTTEKQQSIKEHIRKRSTYVTIFLSKKYWSFLAPMTLRTLHSNKRNPPCSSSELLHTSKLAESTAALLCMAEAAAPGALTPAHLPAGTLETGLQLPYRLARVRHNR
ncbi:hypothetical protein EK904_014553 [Melospiza melodia maxima]|nr:hypothetical protein EK904_014553 [Melospiza melodia maxima]